MPLQIKGNVYPLPHEGDVDGLTGSEIIAIEDYFGLDGMLLFRALASNAEPPKGYTRAKAIFALAWVCLVRAGEIVSLQDVLNDYTSSDIEFLDDDEQGKGEAPKSSAADTETE